MMNELMGWSFNFGFMPYGASRVLLLYFRSQLSSTGERW